MTRISSDSELVEYVRAARQARTPFEIVGGGTRRAAGNPMPDLPVLDVGGLSGIVDYQPEELIVTARPGTPLEDIKAALLEKNQCLGFDPVEGKWFGGRGRGTLGGAVSADASGSGRLRHGAPRDSLLGFKGVNGLGESFAAGAKVVKNVTGFDLPKLVCGAYGTLAVLSELTFRVYPRPAARATLLIRGLNPQDGFALLRRIWQSALEPSGLAYLPSSARFPALGDIGLGAALIRFEAAAQPLSEKLAAARLMLGDVEQIDGGDGLFAAIGEGALFTNTDLDVWRVTVTPSEAARVAAALNPPLWMGDWAGGLLWLGAGPEDGPRIRALVAEAGGHAALLRAPAERRARLGFFAAQPPALAALSQRVKAAFDPQNLFNPGRL